MKKKNKTKKGKRRNVQIIKYKPRFTFILYGDFFCLYLIGHDQTFRRLDKKGGRAQAGGDLGCCGTHGRMG